MSLAALTAEINCYELRATTRTPSGDWNLYCRKNGERTTAAKCAGCKTRQPIKDENRDK